MVGLSLSIDLNSLAEIGQIGVRRAASFIALGERAWSDESLRSVRMNLPMGYGFLPDPLPEPLADAVRSEFKDWIVANAFLELERHFVLFADEYHKVAVYLSRNGQIIGEEAIHAINRFKNDTNLTSKFESISSNFSLTAPLSAHLDGWARARNCLTHNHGFVRERDCQAASSILVISWGRLAVSIAGKVIPSKEVRGTVAERDQSISLSLIQVEKRLSVGEKIKLNAEEMMEICFTASLLISQLVSKLNEFMKGDSQGD